MQETGTKIPHHLSEKYERDGYVILDLDDLGVSEEVLDGCVADVAGKYSPEGPYLEDGVYYLETRVQDAWRISENIRALARNPKILELLEDLYGRRPLPFQTLNFSVGTQQATHSDTIHFNSMPAGYMCGVWVALEDVDMDNGPLVYYPGTHKLPELTMRDVGAEPKGEDYPKYERYIKEMIEREGMEPAYSTIRKGQGLVWASNLLHGGAPQRDLDRTRLSQVTHYFFEGCKYYTPMLTDGEDVTWRDPIWLV
jgi:ectoine hydroxylase-related dioxygenase (phytanoyl-CoA dioxygenase family)